MKEKKYKKQRKKMERIMHLIKSIFAIFSEILQQTIRKKVFKEWTKGKKNYNYCFSIKFLFAYGTAHILQEIGHNDNTYCNSSFVIFYSQINSSIRPLHLLFFFVIFFLRDVIFYSVYYIVCSLYFLMNSYSFR